MSRGFGGVYIDSVDLNRQRPVLAHGGVVDVDDEVLAWSSADRKPVRAPLTEVVLELLDLPDQTNVSAYDLSAEVPKRDVEPARPLLDTVAPVPQGLGLFDGVDHWLCLTHLYDDQQLRQVVMCTHGHVSGPESLNKINIQKDMNGCLVRELLCSVI